MPLYIAVENNRMPVVAFLLLHGASTEWLSTKYGWSPLHLASVCGQTDEVRRLIDEGGDVNVLHKRGTTPLLLAAENDHLPVAECLVGRGADVNKTNRGGMSPLAVAAGWGDVSVVQYLL